MNSFEFRIFHFIDIQKRQKRTIMLNRANKYKRHFFSYKWAGKGGRKRGTARSTFQPSPVSPPALSFSKNRLCSLLTSWERLYRDDILSPASVAFSIPLRRGVLCQCWRENVYQICTINMYFNMLRWMYSCARYHNGSFCPCCHIAGIYVTLDSGLRWVEKSR